jgi:hypothetical protein
LPPAAAKLNIFRAAFSLILLCKINENAALKNIIWRRKPPNDLPEAFYTTPYFPDAPKIYFATEGGKSLFHSAQKTICT